MKIGTFVSMFGAMLSVVFMGCSGTLKGIIRQDAERVPFNYSDSRIGKGILQTVLPDGERFEGRLIKTGSMTPSTDVISNETDSGFLHFKALQSFGGDAEATLSGNRGQIMKCRFKLADTIIGLSSGGYGICQISDGRVIDIFY